MPSFSKNTSPRWGSTRTNTCNSFNLIVQSGCCPGCSECNLITMAGFGRCTVHCLCLSEYWIVDDGTKNISDRYFIVCNTHLNFSVVKATLQLQRNPSQPLGIAPINQQAYWPSSLSTIKPIDHQDYRSLSLSTM